MVWEMVWKLKLELIDTINLDCSDSGNRVDCINCKFTAKTRKQNVSTSQRCHGAFISISSPFIDNYSHYGYVELICKK